MSKTAERKFWRCVALGGLFIVCMFGLSIIAPGAPIPEILFTGGLALSVVAGLVFG